MKTQTKTYLEKQHYPVDGAEPIHPVMDWCKVRHLIMACKRGDRIPPILLDGKWGNAIALTGTHRMAANEIMAALGYECRIPWIDLADVDVPEEIQEAIENGTPEPIDEWWDGVDLAEGEEDGESVNYLDKVY